MRFLASQIASFPRDRGGRGRGDPHPALRADEHLRAAAVQGQQEPPDGLPELVMIHIGLQAGTCLSVHDKALIVDGT